MSRVLFLVAVALAAVSTPTLTTAGQGPSLERGKYLVEEVGRCQECHTPKTETGEFDQLRWLKGTTLIGVPSSPVADRHQKSPDITSTSALWTRWGQDGFSKFLQTAKNPRGNKAGPPMPAYMLKADDADAIVAYLKSLP
jgi:mono/diheme cytochrome c family protein